MPPREQSEGTPLVDNSYQNGALTINDEQEHKHFSTTNPSEDTAKKWWKYSSITFGVVIVYLLWIIINNNHNSISENEIQTLDKKEEISTKSSTLKYKNGPYKLVELQEGDDFFDYYNFFDGADSLGSAGYNTYISKDRAEKLKLMNVTSKSIVIASSPGETITNETIRKQYQLKTKFRDSIRLEGKKKYNSGLFIIDLKHIPVGCGVWPAFWLTNEDDWPNSGEIDIVEGINFQTTAKTALHTRDRCDMFAHVADYNRTGYWDRSTGLPDTFTGVMDFNTSMPADNCWNFAPHQWFNQGCVTVSKDTNSIGVPFNTVGGGIYVLEWDPTNRRIRSWVFTNDKPIPQNLKDSLDTASLSKKSKNVVLPDTDSWNVLPYAYFAIGDGTGCSADHFKDMHIVLNMAFCGTVAGNRYFVDCPAEITSKFNVSNNPVASCNAYISSNPDEINENAYWDINGIYVYERA